MSEFLFREVFNEKTARFLAENIAKNYSINQGNFVKTVTQGYSTVSIFLNKPRQTYTFYDRLSFITFRNLSVYPFKL
jgi:hypothetical protein